MAFDAVRNQYAPAAGIVSLTDNSGGTASDAIAAITDVPTKNAVASLAAKVNALIAACEAAGITVTV